MDRLEAMGLFVAVADAGSFSAAARLRHLPVSTVSRKVAALEAMLSVRLITRNTKALVLTEAGRDYLTHCRHMLAAMEEAEAALQRADATITGSLRVSAPAILGRYFVAPLLARFVEAHGALQAELSLSDRLVDLVGEGFDVAIRSGGLTDSSVISRRLGVFRRFICCAPAYLDRHGPLGSLGALQRAGGLIFTRLPEPETWRLADRAGRLHAVEMRGRMTSDSADALYQAALEGAGLILTPSWQAAPDLAAGRLVRVLDGFATPDVPVHALFPQTRLLPRRVRAFIEASAEGFARFILPSGA